MTLEQFHDELASLARARRRFCRRHGWRARRGIGGDGRAFDHRTQNYQDVNAEFENLLPRADALRAELLQLMVHDADAYRRVMDAYQLPKDTDAAKTARADAIQSALQHAANVPLRVAQACAEILEMAQRAAARGNKNAASDAGAGALMAEAGLRAALLNVEINLGLIQDERFVARLRAEIQPLEQRAAQRQAILDTVHTRL